MRAVAGLASLAALSALLSGCAFSLHQVKLTGTSDRATTIHDGTAACAGVGRLTYAVHGYAGSVEVVVTDATGILFDSGQEQSGGAEALAVQGGHDDWKVQVWVRGFGGAWSVDLTC